MKFRTLQRHFREGAKNIVRNSWMSVASVGAVTVTLVLVGTFVALMLNINQMAVKVEEDVEIKALIELTADEDEVKIVGEEIERIPGVNTVRFSSKDDELESLVEGMGEQGQAWALFEQDNPLNHAYVIKAKNPQDTEQIASKIEQLDNIYKVNYGQEVVPQLFKFNKYARTIGVALIVGLVLTAVFLISNTIKLTIMARSREIGIMKLVGATNTFIRLPFFVEGLLLGILGSVIPIAIIATGYYYTLKNVSGQTSFHFVQLLPYSPFVWQISAIILFIGAFIGMWGSGMSVRKFLKV
ncbi:permease-like cell division protein FtsX [Pseudogracilibacillus auburnensis]|uniref:Cell division protein FtsX n=1 Tax=Pseudogracilibacillus auburnensis TaxID=1494959 RepID=A0A2V3W5W9_9BACI|nr:permease-like cell division protein FtsX [Pseudogracilibacillus auburnensis]MBO1001556.1 ABC transporter permease [Pseudogracilibacillus auburnensis]PXW89522.1 cell division protein FtsX [Pseudogracilibacillus auburnensis]